MPIIKLNPRTRLRKFLEGQLKLLERSKSSQSNVLVPLLRSAVEGLVALEYGESQPMFAQGDRKGSHDGTRPYTVRKLRMQAQGYADLLIAHKYKGKEAAIRFVAAAYGVKADRFRGWRKSKRLGKTTDPLMQSFRTEIAKLAWNEVHVLSALQEAGVTYLKENKLAHKSKK